MQCSAAPKYFVLHWVQNCDSDLLASCCTEAVLSNKVTHRITVLVGRVTVLQSRTASVFMWAQMALLSTCFSSSRPSPPNPHLWFLRTWQQQKRNNFEATHEKISLSIYPGGPVNCAPADLNNMRQSVQRTWHFNFGINMLAATHHIWFGVCGNNIW